MKSLLAFGILAFGQAHMVEDDVSDDVLLHGKEDDFLDKSALNVEKEVSKFPLLDKFSDQDSSATRGNVVITKNKANKEILGIELEETVAPTGDFQQTLQAKCNENQFYQLEVSELNLFTSMTACYYLNTIGLNDTISF